MYNIDKSYEVIKTIKSIKETMHFIMEEQLKELRLTGPQGMIVGTLSRNGKMKIGELSAKMCLSVSTVSAIVDRLVKQNVIAREKSEEDGRVVYVCLTESFKHESKDKFDKIEAFWLTRINQASEDEMTRIIDGLSLLENILKRSHKDA